MRNYVWGLLLLLTAVGAVVFHAQTAEAVLEAGERCALVLVPSLYLFSVLAAFFCTSGMQETAAAPLQRLLRTDARLLIVAVFSQVGGYPVGAQLLHGMRRAGDISEETERRMLCICMGCGPGFLFGTVCRGLPLRASLWMLVSISLPNLLLFPFIAERKRSEMPQQTRGITLHSFTDSVEQAAAAMLKISGMVMAFAALRAILDSLGVLQQICTGFPFPARAEALVHTILEVSCITEYMRCGGTLPMAAALLSFGGICVHLQIAAISGSGLPWGRFWGCRVLTACMTYGICGAGMRFLFPDVLETALVPHVQPSESGSIVPGICLLCMSVWVLWMGRKQVNINK